jgi:uncharacterized membrane protein
MTQYEYEDSTRRPPRRGLGRPVGAIMVGAAAAAALAMWSRQNRARGIQPRVKSNRRFVDIQEALTVNRPIAEVYGFWRNFQNFPSFMRHLESVELLDDRRSRWRATAPAGFTVEWDAEMIGDRSDEWIAWRSLEGSDVQHSGSVRFEHAPGARGTEVYVELQYAPPAGRLGRNVARLFGEEPEQQIRDDLRRFKQIMETGEIPLSDSISLKRPAQPAASPEEIRSLAGVER